MKIIKNNNEQQFETIKIVDKHGNCIDITVELPDEPKPQIIEYPSFTKEIMITIYLLFIVVSLIIFDIGYY